MTQCIQTLKELIEDTVFPDIEDAIDDIFESIASNKKPSKEQEEELKELNALRDEFQSILKDIDENNLEEDECGELLREISDMIAQMEAE
jgi:chromosome segregation ATPase